MKKFGCIILILGLLLILAWFKPWKIYNLNPAQIIGLDTIEQKAGLTVFSLMDGVEIYLDNEYKAVVDASGGMVELNNIEPGIHRVTLQRKQDSDANYYVFSKTLNFLEGVSNIAAYELGPSKQFSQGHVFYAQELVNDVESGKTLIDFNSDIPSVGVMLDGNAIGETPIQDWEIDLNKQYDVTLEKEGYEKLNFTILPSSETEREKLKGMHLFIEADLFLKPIVIEN